MSGLDQVKRIIVVLSGKGGVGKYGEFSKINSSHRFNPRQIHGFSRIGIVVVCTR